MREAVKAYGTWAVVVLGFLLQLGTMAYSYGRLTERVEGLAREVQELRLTVNQYAAQAHEGRANPGSAESSAKPPHAQAIPSIP